MSYKKENYGQETKKRGLQKFTDIDFVNNLLKQTKIANEDLNKLTKRQQILFTKEFTVLLNNARDEDKDRVLDKIIDRLPEKTRNEIWEINHANIQNAIMEYIDICGNMPTKTRIADATGLSRQTIDKHLKEFKHHPLYKDHKEQYEYMLPKVLGEVLRQCLKGDMRAAKLYFDVVSEPKGKTKINTQNNYLQINGIVVDEEKLSRLKPDQLQQLEKILQSVSDAEVIEN